jgi:hypothetical protein
MSTILEYVSAPALVVGALTFVTLVLIMGLGVGWWVFLVEPAPFIPIGLALLAGGLVEDAYDH